MLIQSSFFLTAALHTHKTVNRVGYCAMLFVPVQPNLYSLVRWTSLAGDIYTCRPRPTARLSENSVWFCAISRSFKVPDLCTRMSAIKKVKRKIYDIINSQ